MALIAYLTKIQFDFGALALVPEDLAALGIARPLVATDKGIVACGLAEMGLPVEIIPDLAVAATRDHCAKTNLRAASAADYETLFREAMG